MRFITDIANALRTAIYIWRLITKEDLRNPFKEWQGDKDKPIYVLANGPSLREFLEDIEEKWDKYKNAEFFVVNDFVHDSRFTLIKPRYCVMSDPLFFEDTIYSERGHKAMNALAEKVSWQMILFIPSLQKESTYLDPVRQNPNIKIVTFHAIPYYSGLESLRHYFYKKGLGNGEFGTVALNALYAALMLGYKTLYVYGIDHTFFNDIAVNDENVLCFKDKHFYEEETVLRPMICHYPGMDNKPYTMAQFVAEKALIFKGHLIMEKFAKAIGATIINCTPNSLVDAYERKLYFKM